MASSVSEEVVSNPQRLKQNILIFKVQYYCFSLVSMFIFDETNCFGKLLDCKVTYLLHPALFIVFHRIIVLMPIFPPKGV